MSQLMGWVLFNVLVLLLLALDLFVFHRNAHEVRTKEAAWLSAFWIALALTFNAGLYYFRGTDVALEFLTGYLIEKALSVDNIFVFVMVFSYFRVPPKYQHRVLFWGIIGALVMRGIMIGAGTYLLEQFHWVIYIFGGFLVVSGIRMATHSDHEIEPEHNPVLRLVRRIMPVAKDYQGQQLFVKQQDRHGRLRRVATPLFVVLIVVETTDLVFALDSIPAVFAVTKDPFIVYTSNVFAILGLRSLYFLLARVINRFHYLELGLSMVLVFVGLKMLLEEIYHVPIGLSLGVVGFILVGSVVASLIFPQSEEGQVPALNDPLEPPPGGGTSPVEASEPPVDDDVSPIEPRDEKKRTPSNRNSAA